MPTFHIFITINKSNDEKVSKEYTYIGTNTTNSTTPVNFTIPDNISDIMVCYGQDNNGQAYGGGIIYGSRNIHPKPCILQVFNKANSTGMLYMFFNTSESVISYYKLSGNFSLRVIIYVR